MSISAFRPTFDYSLLAEHLPSGAMEAFEPLTRDAFFETMNHGDLPRWKTMIEALPALDAAHFRPGDRIEIGRAEELDTMQRQQIELALHAFIPWRKGPWSLFGIDLDTEWRSDLKWHRLLPHIEPLEGRRVMDVGCGNGYHCYRMLEEGTRLVIGMEPHMLYFMQFWLLRRFTSQLPLFLMRGKLEQLKLPVPVFDTVFSMGVLYHCRSPFDHLLELKDCLRSGGELVLETLVVDGPEGYTMTPQGRYGRMGNVWFIPSAATTESWLQRCGFRNVRTVDINVTLPAEQRRSRWMPYQSLVDGLDPADHGRTIEGLPAPKRAIVLAEKP